MNPWIAAIVVLIIVAVLFGARAWMRKKDRSDLPDEIEEGREQPKDTGGGPPPSKPK